MKVMYCVYNLFMHANIHEIIYYFWLCRKVKKEEFKMRQRISQRQQKIIQMLRTCDSMAVDEIAVKFNVTATTIRRDLICLENNRLILRSRGYAQIVENPSVSPFEVRKQIHSNEKMLIAQKALEYLNHASTVIIDSGTSTNALANRIAYSDIGKLAVITNSLPVASVLAGKCMVMVTGGMVEEATLALVGPDADVHIESVVADMVFIGATGIDTDAGLTVSSPLHFSIKRKMIKSAKENIILIDSSKFKTGGFNVFCKLNEIGRIITVRTKDNKDEIEKLIDKGVKIDYIDNINM